MFGESFKIRVIMLKKLYFDIPLPPKPILNTLLESVEYYAVHKESNNNVLFSLPEDAVSIDTTKTVANDISVKNDRIYIQPTFSCIINLLNRHLSFSESFEIIDSIV